MLGAIEMASYLLRPYCILTFFTHGQPVFGNVIHILRNPLYSLDGYGGIHWLDFHHANFHGVDGTVRVDRCGWIGAGEFPLE